MALTASVVSQWEELCYGRKQERPVMQTRDVIALAIVVIMVLGGLLGAFDIKGDIKEVRRDVTDLRERMTRVETLLEQLLKKEGLAINDD